MGGILTVSLAVDIDLDDLADELSEEQFDYLADAFSTSAPSKQVAVAAINSIRRGDAVDAITTLERFFLPKWSDREACQLAYDRAVGVG